MAAKKTTNGNSDRSDPKKNKSLAIRNVVNKMPTAKATEIVQAVKKEYGHSINTNMVYMIKTKTNMAKTRKETKTASSKGRPESAAQWVEAIQIAKELLKVTGGVDNATALLKALNS